MHVRPKSLQEAVLRVFFSAPALGPFGPCTTLILLILIVIPKLFAIAFYPHFVAAEEIKAQVTRLMSVKSVIIMLKRA